MEDEMTQVPEGLPTLTRNAHDPGTGMACVMELVSVLAGEVWTDAPACVESNLASAARLVNDYTDDEGRRQLLEMVELFINTACPRGSAHSMELDQKTSDIWFPGLAQISRRSCGANLVLDRDRYAELLRTEGIPLLRDMIRVCDEMNGYGRSAQERQPVVEKLREIVGGR